MYRAPVLVGTIAFLASFAAAAVDVSDSAVAAKNDAGSEVRVKGVNGILLHRLDVAPNHTVEFFQLDTGMTAVRETYPADSGEHPMVQALNASGKQPFSLAIIFRGLTQNEPPASLLKADSEAAMLAEDARNWPKAATRPDSLKAAGGASRDLATSLNQSAKSANVTTLATSAAQSCSSDVFGDNWGAQWFLDHYCNTGVHRTCWTNVLAGHTTRSSFNWWSFRQMEGDFNLPGHSNGAQYMCTYLFLHGWVCNWAQSWSQDLTPRAVTVWTVNGSNDGMYANGTSQCGHAHMATLYDEG